MKYVLPVILLCMIVIMPACQNSTASEEVESKSLSVVNDVTGKEIWDKTIQYHDPEGKWTTFSGKVSLATSMFNGYNDSEEIEIDNVNGIYMSTRTIDHVKVSKGTRGDKCFLAVDGEDTDTDADKEKYNFNCDQAIFAKEHHSSHLGMPMVLKEAGVEVDSEVSTVTLSGKEYYAIRFSGRTDEVIHSYWTATRTMYVDPETYAMYGIKYEDGDWEGAYFFNIGELAVNGIRMAQLKLTYKADDSFWLTDVFSTVG